MPMEPHTGPEAFDFTCPLRRDLQHQRLQTRRTALAPPVIGTPDDLARRDNAGIAQVGCLLPANPGTAELAIQLVGTGPQDGLPARAPAIPR
jgi:hypothetical protein